MLNYLLLSVLLLSTLSIDVSQQLKDLQLTLKNKRVAFLTNPTGVDHTLTPIYQSILSSPYNTTLVCFFAPEHGLRGDQQAGSGDQDYIDSITNLPVYSLYGTRKAPTSQQLKNVDTLVYDIQDVGSRYYTYIWTLTYTMEALARENKELVVFDRPNPLGSRIQGCVLSIDAGLIGRLLPGQKYSIPVRYGLTIGEFVLYVKPYIPNIKVTIIKMYGYDPDSIDQIPSYLWVMSSPNMPTLSTVFVYPGMGIFQGTSISEGRGTTRPFQISGVGNMTAQNVSKQLENITFKGALLRPMYFIPTFSKYENAVCGGIQIHVTNREIFQPVRTAFHLLHAYYLVNKNISISSGIDRMVGFSGFSTNIKFFSPDDILSNCKENLTLFDRQRQSIFLYKNRTTTSIQ